MIRGNHGIGEVSNSVNVAVGFCNSIADPDGKPMFSLATVQSAYKVRMGSLAAVPSQCSSTIIVASRQLESAV